MTPRTLIRNPGVEEFLNPDKALLHLAGATGAALVLGFSVLRYIVRRGQ